MPNAERTITINAPIDTVFAFFTTPANDASWRGGVKEMHAHGAPAVGSVIHQVIAGPMGRGINADIEITDYSPNTRYAFKAIGGPFRPVGSYDFASVAGGTSVTFTLGGEISGFKKLMMEKPIQKNMAAEMAALDNAKKLLEG
jgi:carbon monoxide dehydrogenase subunit G